ncbi:hypothetical protein VTJ04DRAFT_4822 [Mycothermus thermophilus]|uniref:uncharacterized protein n=1 Tax=Humicola insolens TaxID=85995 RepID=UPI00374336CE
MLERTAASIEPCSSSLQRVLPSATVCVRTRRKLHTSFWRHGAADLELVTACQALVRHSSAESHKHGSMIFPNTGLDPAATISQGALLDFLYPNGAASLLRRPSYVLPIRLDTGTVYRNPMPRLFTSAVPRMLHPPSDSPNTADTAAATAASSIADFGAGTEVDNEEELAKDSGDELKAPGDQLASDRAKDEEDPEIELLRDKILDLKDAGAYDKVYELYHSLEPRLKERLAPVAIDALSVSEGRRVDVERMYEILDGFPPHLWTEHVVQTVIESQLDYRRINEAFAAFQTSLKHHGLPWGLDHLAAYAFRKTQWRLLLKVLHCYRYFTRDPEFLQLDPGYRPDKKWSPRLLDILEEEDDREVLASFEKHDLETDADLTSAPPGMPASDPAQPQDAMPTAAEVADPSQTQHTEELRSRDADSALQPESNDLETSRISPEPTPDLASESTPSFDSLEQTEPAHHEPEADVTLPEQVQVGPMSSTQQHPEPAMVEEARTLSYRYPLLAAVENMGHRLHMLYEFLNSKQKPSMQPGKSTPLVDNFLRHVLRTSMDLVDVDAAVFILHRSHDPHLYERYIPIVIDQGRNRIARQLYRKYRVSNPTARTPGFLLEAMPDVFLPHDTLGMEQLLEDWYRTYGRLNKRAYRLFIHFYAGQGNSKIVERLAKEYETHYGVGLRQDPNYLSTLMRAHAIRGDPVATHQVMAEAAEKYGLEPEIKHWNLILQAHSKSGDYGATIRLFTQICDELEPDPETFSIMMSMAALRGDLQFTLDLFQLSRRYNIQPTMQMLRSLVVAYCANDRVLDAEKICYSVTKKREASGDYATLWNTVIQYRSRRRDLVGVNKAAEAMTVAGIAYNQETYQSLLIALVRTRQLNRAWALLQVARQEGAIDPSPTFYLPLMKGYLAVGQPQRAIDLHAQLESMGYPASTMRMLMLIDTMGRWQQLRYQDRLGADGAFYLRSMLRHFHRVFQEDDQPSTEKITTIISLFSTVSFFLIQMGQFHMVDKLIGTFQARFPQHATLETLPLRFLHQSLLADYLQKRYDRAKETWNVILHRSSWRYQPAGAYLTAQPANQEAIDGGNDMNSIPPLPVLYAQRFRLADPLKTMQRMYLELGDADAMIELVDNVRRLGFDLTNKNWNYHVQALARLKRLQDAFNVCETVLMPQWTGWHQVRMRSMHHSKPPLEARRIGLNPRRPRPLSFTLLILAKEYLELEEAMLWSQEAAYEFEQIEDKCPKTVFAVKTMLRTGSELEREIFAGIRRTRGIRDKIPYPGFEVEQKREELDDEASVTGEAGMVEREQEEDEEPVEEADEGEEDSLDTHEDEAYAILPREWSEKVQRKGPTALEELWDEFLKKREERLRQVTDTWVGGRMVRPWQRVVLARRHGPGGQWYIRHLGKSLLKRRDHDDEPDKGGERWRGRAYDHQDPNKSYFYEVNFPPRPEEDPEAVTPSFMRRFAEEQRHPGGSGDTSAGSSQDGNEEERRLNDLLAAKMRLSPSSHPRNPSVKTFVPTDDGDLRFHDPTGGDRLASVKARIDSEAAGKATKEKPSDSDWNWPSDPNFEYKLKEKKTLSGEDFTRLLRAGADEDGGKKGGKGKKT